MREVGDRSFRAHRRGAQVVVATPATIKAFKTGTPGKHLIADTRAMPPRRRTTAFRAHEKR
jgi:hypothetical protein